MTNRTWLGMAALAALLAAPRAVDAADVGGTIWALSGKDTLKIGGYRATKTAITPTDASFSPTQSFAVTASFLDYSGTWTASGKRGFKATLDQASLDAVRTYLVDKTIARTGASSVDVKSLKVAVKGSLSKDGTKLVMKTKMVLKGAAHVGRRTLHGTVTDSESFKGVPTT